jgi:molybdopterin molybdotransferase
VGGCPVGVNDSVPEAVNSLGKPGIIIHGILVRPGHPAGFGVVDGKPIIMLPGHVVAAMVGFYLLVVPLIGVYGGLKAKAPSPSIRARMAEDVKPDPRYSFLRVYLGKIGDGYFAKPVRGGANTLTTLTRSHGFIVVPPNIPVRKGEEVKVTPFSRIEFSHLRSTEFLNLA